MVLSQILWDGAEPHDANRILFALVIVQVLKTLVLSRNFGAHEDK